MVKRRIPVLLLILLSGVVGRALADPVSAVSPSYIALDLDGHAMRIPYFRNYSIDSPRPVVTRAVVVVHGNSRNCWNTYAGLREASGIAGRNDGTVLLVAPHFLIEEDIDAHGLPGDVLFWTSGGWKRGDTSEDTGANPRPVQVSSYAVMDSVLVRIAAVCPNLNAIVLAGHSAGGQYVNRFSAGSPIEQILESSYGVDVSYVVANPSSYLYFSPERLVPGSGGQFAVPPLATIQACPDYDDYKYGLQVLNDYMSTVGVGQILAQFPGRRVGYLLGALDDNPNHSSLDTSCPAALQGDHRLERGLVYTGFLEHHFGAAALSDQDTHIIEGVGHSSSGIYTSTCGVAWLFGGGACPGTAVPDFGGEGTLALAQNVPNPFRSRTTIRFTLPGPSPVSLRVFDVAGREVSRLIEGELPEGPHEVDFAPPPGGSGVYWYRLRAAGTESTKKLTVVR